MKDAEMPIARRLVTTLIKKGTEMTESVSEIVKQEGLTIQQFNVMRILRGRKGKAANLQEVSSKMIHSNSNTTRVIDKLISKDYVKRKQCPSDRRQIEITITDKGLQVLKNLDADIDARELALIDNLDENQVKQVLEYLSKL
ncbi:MarR family transcriptional regulator [Nonlabens arenilitoris]|uniref:MarR family transcriptional regulator n=1 Tax=Nonlabens arenilitoris TaxID=1217969 RepID=A0A2S7UDE7_9FLAO|nr:MarR family transcriptional regulator [Nonlabens arenilitoris]PQJ32657.1 MarR family transcriptional regulator [Nonlabens arenilitoris]